MPARRLGVLTLGLQTVAQVSWSLYGADINRTHMQGIGTTFDFRTEPVGKRPASLRRTENR